MNPDIDTDSVRALFDANVRGDLDSARALLAENFVFTSPQDDHIDKESYLRVSFPTASRLDEQTMLHVVSAG